MQDALSFSSFASKIDLIYGDTNKKRDFEYMYSYLCRNNSYLSRAILRDGNAKIFFARSFSWLFAVANKLDIDLGDAFRKKFPKVCPYCLASTCQCAETHRAPVNNIALHTVRSELNEKYLFQKRSSSELYLDNATTIIGIIYPANKAIWNAFGSFYHFSRLFEELGEVHEAYSNYRKTKNKLNLEEELADVTAWLLSAWGIHQKGASLSDCLIDYYMDNCPVCKKSSCTCQEYSDRSQMLSDKTSLENVKTQIIELLTLEPSLTRELNDLVQSMDQAILTTSTVDAKQAVNSAKKILSQVESAVHATDDVAGRAGKLASAIQSILASIDGLKSFWS
ncbi:hypothetical protein [Pseudomonas viridiflava]|uniref:hypothetical protein n=1 Tax=Pseudomonas viridiflava TaxID=33069 RepID=UPI0013CEFE9F|nr:hypothetical protein [Pseudomonas viridiflava]